MDLRFVIGAVWVGLYALLIGAFGWVLGAAAGWRLGGEPAAAWGGVAGLSLLSAIAFGCARADHGPAAFAPFFLAVLGGLTVGGGLGFASAHADGAFGLLVGIVVGFFGGILIPDTGVKGAGPQLGTALASGLVAGLVGTLVGGVPGWAVGGALGLAGPPLIARLLLPDAADGRPSPGELALAVARRALGGALAGGTGAALVAWAAGRLVTDESDTRGPFLGQLTIAPAILLAGLPLARLLRLWRGLFDPPAARRRPLRTVAVHDAPLSAVAFSNDGRRAISADLAGHIETRNADTGEAMTTADLPTDWHGESVLSADGARLVVAGVGLAVFDTETGKEVARLASEDVLPPVAFLPGARRLLYSGVEGLERWDSDTGEAGPLGEVPVNLLLALAAGGTLGATRAGPTVELFDPADGTPRGTIDLGTGRSSLDVRALALSPDGTRLAVGLADGSLIWYDTDPLRQAGRSASAHGARVHCVTFAPDGTRLASGGGDHTVRIWDVSTGHELLRLEGHGGWLERGAVETLAFSPNGSRLLTGSTDQTVRLWDVSPGDPS